jgi:acetoin utilization deacetylase AcuC-like enzyme
MSRSRSRSTVVVGWSEAFAAHEVDAEHPERPARSDAAREAAERLADRAGGYEVHEATRTQIEQIHHHRHVDEVAATANTVEPVRFDDDTTARAATYPTALLAAGAAVDAVFTGGAVRAFSLARPPGHHAEVERAMGYCFFNNVAIDAQHALDAHGCQRVAIANEGRWRGRGAGEVSRMNLEVSPAGANEGRWRARAAGEVSP